MVGSRRAQEFHEITPMAGMLGENDRMEVAPQALLTLLALLAQKYEY